MKDPAYDEFIDRLRSESDIVRIISDYVPLKKKGRNYWGCCPFHHEKTASFSVASDKGFFYCFGCQSGGNVFNFLMKVENIGFLDAVKLLAQKMNIPLPEKQKSVEEIARDKEIAELYRINELARDFFHSCLTKTGYGKAAREYLSERRVTEESVRKFKLGFAPQTWDKLATACLERGISQELLVKVGLAVSRPSGDGIYDRFRDRVMFPICDARGRVIGFGGRVLGDSHPKYLNSPETLIFNKRHILYGLEIAYKPIREIGKAIIVEGYLDAITAHAAGINNVVASLGTAFTPEQARMLSRNNVTEIIFAYDSDAAGQSAALRAMIIVRSLGMAVRVVCIPDGKDPDEFIRKHGADAFRTLIAEAPALLEYQVKQALDNVDYSSLEGKVSVVAKVVPALAASDNAVEVDAHIIRLSQVLSIDESSIRNEFKKFVALSRKDKTVNSGKDITMRTLSKQPTSAVSQAERHLIRLMCEESSLIPYVQASLSSDDFQDERCREIAKLIFNAADTAKAVEPDALSLVLSETANNELSHIMLLDIQCIDIHQTVDDYIKTIKKTNLNNLAEQCRLKVVELESMGDSRYLQELAELQRINNEITKLHQSSK